MSDKLRIDLGITIQDYEVIMDILFDKYPLQIEEFTEEELENLVKKEYKKLKENGQ